MQQLESYVGGNWQAGTGDPTELLNPASEDVLAYTSTAGIDFAATLDFARNAGGPALRSLSFAQRAGLLQSMYDAIYAHRDELLDLSIANGGNTRNDAKFDVDGATGTLLAYADLGRTLGDQQFLLDGEVTQLGRTPRYAGRHLLTPLQGAAVHVNAYNFPAWGFAEKAAVALLAGMPVVTKPATSTALLAFRMMQLIVESNALPAGALSFIAGSVGDLLDHLGAHDVLAFTGSGDTAARLRGHAAHTERSARVNVEADSLNAAVLGPDVELGSDTWQLMLNEVVTDVRQKAGQKCTAIRRVLVPPGAWTIVSALSMTAWELLSSAIRRMQTSIWDRWLTRPSCKTYVPVWQRLQPRLPGSEAKLSPANCTVSRPARVISSRRCCFDANSPVPPPLFTSAKCLARCLAS